MITVFTQINSYIFLYLSSPLININTSIFLEVNLRAILLYNYNHNYEVQFYMYENKEN